MLADRLRQVTADDGPSALGLINQTSVERSTLIVSNTVTIADLPGTAGMLVTNGEYRKNGGAFTTGASTITNGDTIALRHTSSASYATSTTTYLQIGGSVTPWSSVTRTQDTTPTAFSFTTASGVERSQVQTSGTITVSGMDAEVTAIVTVAGGTYSKNGAGQSNAITTAVNGDTFSVQHVSSAAYSSSVQTTLTINSAQAIFTSTTRSIDQLPDAFSFSSASGVDVGSTQYSNSITITGMDADATASVSVSNGYYSRNGFGLTSAGTTAVNGDSFYLARVAPDTPSTSATVTLTVGGRSGTFTISTRAADTTPAAWTFTDLTNVTLSTTYESNTVTITGMDAGYSAAVSVTGTAGRLFAYSKNGGAYTTAAGTAVAGDTFKVRIQAESFGGFTSYADLTVGGVTERFQVTTRVGDTTPNAFAFTDQTGAALNSWVVSNDIVFSGIEAGYSAPYAYSGSNGTFQWARNGSESWFSTNSGGSLTNGESMRLRVLTDNTLGKSYQITLSIGGSTGSVSDTWNVVAGTDGTPNAFAFTDLTGATRNLQHASAAITVSGLSPGYKAVVQCSSTAAANGGFIINNGAIQYMGSTGLVQNGDTVKAVLTTANTGATTVGVEVGIGTISDIFFVTTT